jgi:hypothetical protein
VNVAPHPLRPLPRPLPLPAPSPSAVPFRSLRSSNPALCPLYLSLPRPGRGGKTLSDRHESPVTSHKSRLFMLLCTLKLSCSFFSYPRPLFSIVCGLFDKNTRGGVPLPDLHGSQFTNRKLRRSRAKTQTCPPVSPLPATLTHSQSRKSFPCPSYANTRDGGATPRKFFSPLATRHCCR